MLTDEQPLALGDPRLDSDHSALQALTSTFRSSLPDRLMAAQALDALRTHAREHFAFEDGELRQLGGPDMQCHLDEHQAVLASLDQVHGMLTDAVTDDAVVTRLVTSLSTELERWLPEHVHYMDVAVATARVKARLGGTAIRIQRRGAD